MSAEILRRAVVRIYHDVEFGQAHGDDTFLLAVANWLDRTANSVLEEVKWVVGFEELRPAHDACRRGR